MSKKTQAGVSFHALFDVLKVKVTVVPHAKGVLSHDSAQSGLINNFLVLPKESSSLKKTSRVVMRYASNASAQSPSHIRAMRLALTLAS